MAELEVNKSGIRWLEITADRFKGGMELWLKADPRIEEAIQGICGGACEKLSSFGAYWKALGADDYDIYRSGKLPTTHAYYMLGAGDILQDGKNRVNLSMLCIKGVSGPLGIRIYVDGPFSRRYIREIPKIIGDAAREFIKDYIVPVHVEVSLNSKEF